VIPGRAKARTQPHISPKLGGEWHTPIYNSCEQDRTSSSGVVRGSGGSTSSTTSPLPVQYAAPWLRFVAVVCTVWCSDVVEAAARLVARAQGWLRVQAHTAPLTMRPWLLCLLRGSGRRA